MKTNPRSPLLAFSLGLLLLCSSAMPLRADFFGPFEYFWLNEGTEVIIESYTGSATGPVSIPAEIEGLPVTTIGTGVFSGRPGLTAVTIPASVNSIGDQTFYCCSGLTSITIPAGVSAINNGTFSNCTGLTSVLLPASVTSFSDSAFSGCTGLTTPPLSTGLASIGEGAFYGCTGLTSALLPASVEYIGSMTFYGCRGLTGVTLPTGIQSLNSRVFYGCTGLTSIAIPATVNYISDYTFGGCTGLKSALFEGNAPDEFNSTAFRDTAPGFTVYYFTNRTGFTSPLWNDYASIGIDPAVWPAATWLLAHGLPYNTNLQLDPDEDGVSLLMAYALNLDPRQNLRSRLPAPVLGADSMSIRYYAAAPGITYRVETSRDLTQWTTTSVTLSALDAENKRTASVPRDAANRFLRLVVQ